MEVHNIMEDLVLEVFEKTVNGIPNLCKCDNCKNDIFAIVLNNLKPKYIATDKGYVYSRAQNTNNQFSSDIIRLIISAADIVKESPRHEK